MIGSHLRCNATSLRLAHAVALAADGLTLTSVGTLEGSFWSPSLGPTSTKDTDWGQFVLCLTEASEVAFGVIAPHFVDRPRLAALWPWARTAQALLNRTRQPRHRIIA